MKAKVWYATSICWAICCFAFGQQPLNLNFEYLDDETQLPRGWYAVEETGCRFVIDTTHSISGDASLLILPSGKAPCSFVVLNLLPAELLHKKQHVLISAYSRATRKQKKVSLISRQLSKSGEEITMSVDYKITKRKKGWTKLLFSQSIHQQTAHFAFGVKGSTVDTIWFDSFEVVLDGMKVSDVNPTIRNADSTEVDWLNEHVIPLTLDEPITTHLASRNLLQYFDDYRVVALGEVTHGSSEIYRMKHQLIDFLIEHGHFSLLTMEMDMVEAEMLNNYVLTGEGDPTTILLSTSYWPWKTAEFLALVELIRSHNLGSNDKVRITGIDIPYSNVTIESILRFGDVFDKKISMLSDSIKTLFQQVNTSADKGRKTIALLEQIDLLSSHILANKESLSKHASDRQLDFLNQSIVTLKQSAIGISGMNKSLHFRDSCMAVNMRWLLDYYPDSKAVLWAHNTHITKSDNSLVDFLDKKYPTFIVGFALGVGTFNGKAEIRGDDIEPMNLVAPVVDSYESYFLRTNSPVWLLNLRSASLTSWQGHWLNFPRKFRYVGSVVPRYQFAYTNLSANYDAVVFIRECSPSNLLFRK